MICRPRELTEACDVARLWIGSPLASLRVMRAHISLELNPGERSALESLTTEEREAVIDDLLAQAREDLEWVVARAAVEESAQRSRVATSPVRRPPQRSRSTR
jgi:hypothetical protein